MRKYLFAAVAATTLILSPIANVNASGGGGYNTGSFSQSRVDHLYELGKSYYRSPQADGSRLEYCVKTQSGLERLTRNSVKPFKRGTASQFVNSLYSCNDPSLKIVDAVPVDHGDAILHYLNKRFKLRLANS